MNNMAVSKKRNYASIRVENFGPIAEGEIHLRPLTVFSGSSNTGKSWIAALIYALYNTPDTDDFWTNEIYEIADDESVSFPEKPYLWAENLKKGKRFELSESDNQVLKRLIETGFRKSRQKNILRCYGHRTQGLVRYGADSGFRIQVSFPDRWSSHEWKYDLISGNLKKEKNWACTVNFPENKDRISSYKRLISVLYSYERELVNQEYRKNEKIQNYITARILRETLRALHFGFESNAWYLPADRGGIMHAHQVVVGALIQNASQFGLNASNPITPLSGILADFLNNLIRLTGNQSPPSHSEINFFDRVTTTGREMMMPDFLSENLEEEIISGRVNVEDTNVNYPKFTWTPHGWKVPLELAHASSMVTELVPLVLFLRHNIRKGDVLILEEPEAHLHPELQVQIVRQAADWARAGIRVILTTHSEWVLDELSNLVVEARSGAGDGLLPEDFGLWQFSNNKKRDGSVIDELHWNLDEGGYDPGYMNVAAKQHTRWTKYAGVDQ